ncbi:MAG: VTC domain-containing protein [Cetobacterium sp.]|nr:VTC domain-containing protein [Cetobacterium sp.]
MNIEHITRIEEKYLISTEKKLQLLTQLKKILIYDEHSNKGKYSVRTLYFDTPTYRDYQDKLNNNQQRKGIRMRIYDVQNISAKLELKMKNNDIQEKISLKIKKEDAQKLINREYHVLKKYKSEVAIKLYDIMKSNNYEPKTTILYNRYAFKCLEKNLRITIDSNLATSNTEFNLWDLNIDTVNVSPVYEHILEIKRIRELPLEIQEIIYPLENEEKPSSKYKRCCNFLYLPEKSILGRKTNRYNFQMLNNTSQNLKKIYTARGLLIYDGEFKNNLPNGKGKLFIEDLIVEGYFKDGKLDGEIKIINTKNEIIKYSSYKNGILFNKNFLLFKK